jgi:hypothetical protein
VCVCVSKFCVMLGILWFNMFLLLFVMITRRAEAMITRRAEHCGSEFWGNCLQPEVAAADMVMDLGESLYVLMVLCCIL